MNIISKLFSFCPSRLSNNLRGAQESFIKIANNYNESLHSEPCNNNTSSSPLGASLFSSSCEDIVQKIANMLSNQQINAERHKAYTTDGYEIIVHRLRLKQSNILCNNVSFSKSAQDKDEKKELVEIREEEKSIVGQHVFMLENCNSIKGDDAFNNIIVNNNNNNNNITLDPNNNNSNNNISNFSKDICIRESDLSFSSNNNCISSTVNSLSSSRSTPSSSSSGIISSSFSSSFYSVASSKQVVFFQHGLLESSLNWISSGERSLPFTMLRMGYDVWLGNSRGNEYVKKCCRVSHKEKTKIIKQEEEFKGFEAEKERRERHEYNNDNENNITFSSADDNNHVVHHEHCKSHNNIINSNNESYSLYENDECSTPTTLIENGSEKNESLKSQNIFDVFRNFGNIGANVSSCFLSGDNANIKNYNNRKNKSKISRRTSNYCSSLSSDCSNDDYNNKYNNINNSNIYTTSKKSINNNNNNDNIYSKKSINNNTNSHISEDEGDWTFEDMARYDIPAMIQKIIQVTKCEKILCFGQSQGAAQLLIAMCMHNNLSKNVTGLQLFAPPVVLNKEDAYTFAVKILVWLGHTCPYVTLEIVRILKMIIPAFALSYLANIVAGTGMKFFLTEVKDEDRRIIFKNTPSGGTSKKNLQHWIQLIKKGSLLSSYSTEETGSIPYPLHKISCPMHIYFGQQDNLVNVDASVEYLKKSFLRSQCKTEILEGYSHVDFGWGSNRAHDFYPHVLQNVYHM